MLRRAFVLLLGTLALAACGGGYGYGPRGGYGYGYGGAPVPLGSGSPPTAGGPTGQTVAILLPLSGARADLGQTMLHAAQLALDGSGAPPLDAKDTGGTPQGAAVAAQAAIADGAGLILGPLTSSETAAVAPIARAANVAVLAFTNDPSQAQPGVWTLGITPGQQVRRLVAAAQGQGKSQFAGLLPDNDFGHAMAQALIQAASINGAAPPNVRFYAPGMPAINAAARDLSDYANRRGPIDAQIRAARALETPEGRRQAQDLAKSSIPPPSFNSLLLADTGDALAEIAAVLPYYDVDRSAVQIIGPALWANPASGSGQMRGAWYAAPDPAARSGFEQAYSAKFGSPPSPVADLAYDAASIARVLGGQGYSVGAITQSNGFVGADGWFGLLSDGQVRRALAVFAIERGGPQMVEPAPQSGNVPGT
jgi:branched-chain amino acid transport system substrate-binding protein